MAILRASFVAKETDENARIHFDLASSDVSVEIASVELLSMTDQKPVQPKHTGSFFVSYKVNALGCRGREYSLPRPARTRRVLVLGDSHTVGVGVHEQDTFTARLENLLKERAREKHSGNTHEVINCGVNGFGTREERLFYEDIASRYQPNIVLIVMNQNDDPSLRDDERTGHVNRQPGKLEYLFFTWAAIQRKRHERPFPILL